MQLEEQTCSMPTGNLVGHTILGMCRIPDGRHYRPVIALPVSFKGADSDTPQSAAVDRPQPAVTQAASLCT